MGGGLIQVLKTHSAGDGTAIPGGDHGVYILNTPYSGFFNEHVDTRLTGGDHHGPMQGDPCGDAEQVDFLAFGRQQLSQTIMDSDA